MSLTEHTPDLYKVMIPSQQKKEKDREGEEKTKGKEKVK